MFWNPLTRLCGASVLCETVQFFLLHSGLWATGTPAEAHMDHSRVQALSGDQQLDVSILYHV